MAFSPNFPISWLIGLHTPWRMTTFSFYKTYEFVSSSNNNFYRLKLKLFQILGGGEIAIFHTFARKINAVLAQDARWRLAGNVAFITGKWIPFFPFFSKVKPRMVEKNQDNHFVIFSTNSTAKMKTFSHCYHLSKLFHGENRHDTRKPLTCKLLNRMVDNFALYTLIDDGMLNPGKSPALVTASLVLTTYQNILSSLFLMCQKKSVAPYILLTLCRSYRLILDVWAS